MPPRKSKTPPAAPNKTIAYIRVSTSQQVDEGHSLEAQQNKLEAYAALYGLEPVATEVDAGVSAATTDRPGLQRALARLEAGEASGILVVKLDRLTRSVRDLSDLIDTYFREYRLLSVHENIDTQSATGRAVLRIITVMSEWERDAAAERTQAVMKHLKASGKFTGGWPPFGYVTDAEGNLLENAEEQAIIRRVRELRGEGRTLRAVAVSAGTNPRTGKRFDSRQIARMVSAVPA